MSFGQPSAPTSQPNQPTPNLLNTIGAILVQVIAVAGIVVLAALKVVTGDAAIGVIGALIGIHGTVAAANLTPNP